MNREQAMAVAIELARKHNSVYVFHCYANTPWIVQSYDTMELYEAKDVRYVLPHGEVCKLS